MQKRAWCKFLSPKHLGDRYCAITSRSCLSKKKKKKSILGWVWIALKKKKISVWHFFCGFYALFTGPANIKFGKIDFKIGSHSTIHTFKNYFTTVFSTISSIQTDPYFAQKYHSFGPNFSQWIRVWSFGASSWAQNTSRIVFCVKTSRTYFLQRYSSFKSSFLCKIRGRICGASFELD